MSSEASANQPVSRVRLWWPVIAFLLMIAWSNIPPYRAHIREESKGLFIWSWKLYQQGGLGYCDVRYFNMHEDGEPIKRWELLGYDRPGAMPDNILRVKRNTLAGDYTRVCQALRKAGDSKPNVQVFARCGVDKGWKTVERRKRNVCSIAPKGYKQAKQAKSTTKAKATP